MRKFYLFLFCWVSTWAQINKNGDFQIWNREIFLQHFNPPWSWYVMWEGRWGDDASKLYHTILQAEVIYKPVKWLSIAPGYRQSLRRFPLNSNHWKPEYSPITDVICAARASGWEFVDRNRVQYIIFQSDPSHWLYRNRIRIIPPWNFSNHCINPFVDNEFFFRQDFGFNEDRLCGGFLIWIRGNLSGQLYYMARFQKNLNPTQWVHQNILNITLLFAY